MIRLLLNVTAAVALLSGVAPLSALDGHDARMLHVLLVTDTADDQVGQLVDLDGQHMYELLTDEIPRARRDLIKVLRGRYVTIDEILGHIRNLPVQSDDSLFVYFSGHGSYVRDRGQVLRMTDGELLDRNRLMTEMKAKGARLTVLITDACSNVVEEGALPKYAYSMPEGLDHDVCRYLFFRHRGVVDIHAASPGEESVALHGSGSIFTNALLDALRLPNSGFRGNPITWREAMQMISEGTSEKFKLQRDTNRDFRLLFPNQTTQTPKVASLGESIPTPIPKVPWRLGIEVEETGGQGVRVKNVFLNSQAEWAGFQVGDVLTQIETGPMQAEVTHIRNSRDFMQTFWSSEMALRPEVHKFILLDPNTGLTRTVRARIRDIGVRQGGGMP